MLNYEYMYIMIYIYKYLLFTDMNILSKKLGLEPHEISFIIKSLQTPLHKDIRDG